MAEGIDGLVKRGSRHKEIAKIDPSRDAHWVKREQFAQRDLGCLVVVGKPLDRSLFFKEWDKSLPTRCLFLGNLRRKDRACTGRVKISESCAGRTDRGVDIRALVRGLNLLTRSGKDRLNRFASTAAHLVERQTALAEVIEQRR
jgi:hypothetical protein